MDKEWKDFIDTQRRGENWDLSSVHALGFPKEIRKWTWLPKRMTSKKIVWVGYYYEIFKTFSTGKTEYWLKTKYSEREYFFTKLKN